MRCFEIMEVFHAIKEQYRQMFLISRESEIKEMFERGGRSRNVSVLIQFYCVIIFIVTS